MIIVKLQGGLGNQMFEYAFARGVAARLDTQCKFDVSGFKHIPGVTDRVLGLTAFSLPIEFASKEEIDAAKKNIIKDDHLFNKKVFSSDNSYFDGYWQDERYFAHIKDDMRSFFTFRKLSEEASRILSDIQSGQGISLQIRRGDYVTNDKVARTIGACDISYYEKAIKKLRGVAPQSKVFVFSDDIEWAKDNIKSDMSLVFVSASIEAHEAILLMAACRHHIISNSSFGWWGAWLDPREDKTVIAPKQWFRDKALEKKQSIVPSSWQRV